MMLEPEADTIMIVPYDNDTVHIDSLFVIHSNKDEEITTISSYLEAWHSDSTLSDFTWMKFNSSTLVFDTLPNKDTNTLFSRLIDIEEGCYRVEIRDTSDSVEVYTVWTFIDHIELSIREASLNRCHKISYSSNYVATNFGYYQIYDTIAIYTDTIWHYENYQSTLTVDDGRSDKLNIYPIHDIDVNPPPKQNATINYEYINHFNNKVNVTDHYNNWMPNIEDQVEYLHSGTQESGGDNSFYAPDEVTININGSEYDSVMWFFGDSLYKDDSIYTNRLYQNSHLYMAPGQYEIKVKVKNNIHGCVDSNTTSFTIVGSYIDPIPNVFTPKTENYSSESDNLNDTFKITGASVRDYSFKIFDRWGRIVYKKEVSDFIAKEEDNGVIVRWDGVNRIAIPNRDCPTGTYIYIFKAYGYDYQGDKNKKDKNDPLANDEEPVGLHKHKGVLYLFREK